MSTENAPEPSHFKWKITVYSRPQQQAQICDVNGHRLFIRRSAITKNFTFYIDGVYVGRSATIEDGKRMLEIEAIQRGFTT